MAKRTSSKSPKPRGRTPRAAPARSAGRAISLRDFCRALPHTTEDIKWGDDLVFSVGGKMYAAFDLDDEEQLAFKCDDLDYEFLIGVDRDGATAKGARGRGKGVDGVIPAPYAARFGWVKVQRRDALPRKKISRLLTKAHAVVFAGLPARVRKQLEAASGGSNPNR